MVVACIASVIAVLFQRDLKNTGTLLFESVIDINSTKGWGRGEGGGGRGKGQWDVISTTLLRSLA